MQTYFLYIVLGKAKNKKINEKNSQDLFKINENIRYKQNVINKQLRPI